MLFSPGIFPFPQEQSRTGKGPHLRISSNPNATRIDPEPPFYLLQLTTWVLVIPKFPMSAFFVARDKSDLQKFKNSFYIESLRWLFLLLNIFEASPNQSRTTYHITFQITSTLQCRHLRLIDNSQNIRHEILKDIHILLLISFQCVKMVKQMKKKEL